MAKRRTGRERKAKVGKTFLKAAEKMDAENSGAKAQIVHELNAALSDLDNTSLEEKLIVEIEAMLNARGWPMAIHRKSKRVFTQLNPIERARRYIYPGGTITVHNVISIFVSDSGTHYLNTANDGKIIVAPGWMAIEIDTDEWTF